MSEKIDQPPAMSAIPHAPTKPKHWFTLADINAVARQCARGLTETEAVRLLGKNPSAWFSFKSRIGNDSKFAARLEQFQGERIDQLLGQIEKAGEGIGVKYPDWRASLAALKVMSQKRFGEHVSDADQPRALPPINIAIIMQGIELALKQAKQLPAAPVMELTETTDHERE